MLALSVENLSKRFRLGTMNRRVFVEDWRHRWEEWRAGGRDRSGLLPGEFWALHELNFEIKEGETVGLIGRNGAGKSTLLKILSRITAPTAGVARIRGRVGSLLEVGMGFHPELTGRENIFLFGSILGMTRAELRGKFDEIVDFAEIERFLETPLKHYSSGMKVKLAFTVAAFLEPEILIVDEALSVGDTKFREKSALRMRKLIGDGRTLLLVSHADHLLTEVCPRSIYLEQGRVAYDGDTAMAMARYRAGTE
jgi:lipopolysaccharide transport system ATP-binding protein